MEERAEAIGGQLRIESGPKGTRVSWRCLLAEKIRVLIADDHAVVRQGLRTFLEVQDDIEVVGEASDGEEAVKLIEVAAPDVVVMDLVMPRVDGIEATRQIRASRARRRRSSC